MKNLNVILSNCETRFIGETEERSATHRYALSNVQG